MAKTKPKSLAPARQKKLDVPGVARVRVDVWGILSDAVEAGLEYGWHRAHKHTDKPGKDAIIQEQDNAIMNEICKYLHFEPPEDGTL